MFARVVIFEGNAQAFCFLALAFDLLLAAETIVGTAQFHQFFRIFLVHGKTLGLHVRSMVTADVRSLIVLQADRFERIVNDIGGPFHQTALIGIFDAEDEISAFMFGDQVFE